MLTRLVVRRFKTNSHPVGAGRRRNVVFLRNGRVMRDRRSEPMGDATAEVATALATLGKDASGPDVKVSAEVLPAVFRNFSRRLGVPDRTSKSEFHLVAPSMAAADIDREIVAVLDKLVATCG